jgi:hypothetical protein
LSSLSSSSFTLTTFGFVCIETGPPSVVIKKMKVKQAQIMYVVQHPSVKSINDSVAVVD